jgi:hypothetical protein
VLLLYFLGKNALLKLGAKPVSGPFDICSSTFFAQHLRWMTCMARVRGTFQINHLVQARNLQMLKQRAKSNGCTNDEARVITRLLERAAASVCLFSRIYPLLICTGSCLLFIPHTQKKTSPFIYQSLSV